MGYSRKEEIAQLKRERKQAKAAKKRQENVRDEHVRFLIVCEGTKTEPYYFEALVKDHGGNQGRFGTQERYAVRSSVGGI